MMNSKKFVKVQDRPTIVVDMSDPETRRRVAPEGYFAEDDLSMEECKDAQVLEESQNAQNPYDLETIDSDDGAWIDELIGSEEESFGERQTKNEAEYVKLEPTDSDEVQDLVCRSAVETGRARLLENQEEIFMKTGVSISEQILQGTLNAQVVDDDEPKKTLGLTGKRRCNGGLGAPKPKKQKFVEPLEMIPGGTLFDLVLNSGDRRASLKRFLKMIPHPGIQDALCAISSEFVDNTITFDIFEFERAMLGLGITPSKPKVRIGKEAFGYSCDECGKHFWELFPGGPSECVAYAVLRSESDSEKIREIRPDGQYYLSCETCQSSKENNQ